MLLFEQYPLGMFCRNCGQARVGYFAKCGMMDADAPAHPY
jgi:hypothetical protein